jgi:TrmH family RNA methyltransferase
MVSDGILKKISDTSYLVPLLAVAHIPTELSEPETMGDFVVVLDRVQDHGNIGTIIRTASAFGIRDIVSTTPTLDVFYKKIISASRGRVFETRVQRYASGGEAIAALKRKGYQVIATSPYARDIQSMAPLRPAPVALVVGNETGGIADDIVRNADIVVQIPMSGQVESLNVGVATGISLYELKFRMVLTMLINYIRANLGREVNVTGKLILQAFDAQIRSVSDLSGQQAILLMILVCDRSMTREQVMRDTGALEHELNALLQPLLEKGYIRYSNEEKSMIVPTETSERTLAQLWSIVERAEQSVLAGFSEQEKEQFRQFLKRIQENCARIVEGV